MGALAAARRYLGLRIDAADAAADYAGAGWLADCMMNTRSLLRRGSGLRAFADGATHADARSGEGRVCSAVLCLGSRSRLLCARLLKRLINADALCVTCIRGMRSLSVDKNMDKNGVSLLEVLAGFLYNRLI